MKSTALLLLLGVQQLLLQLQISLATEEYAPKGVHLAIGADPTSMAVYWATCEYWYHTKI